MQGSFRDRGSIDCGSDRFTVERLRDADSDVSGDTGLRFLRGRTEVRGERDIRHAKEWIFFRLQRFIRPYVDAGSGHFAGFQCVGECFDIDDGAAGRIDKADTVFHFSEFFFSDHAARLIRERGMQGDVVGLFEKGVQIDKLDAELFAAL